MINFLVSLRTTNCVLLSLARLQGPNIEEPAVYNHLDPIFPRGPFCTKSITHPSQENRGLTACQPRGFSKWAENSWQHLELISGLHKGQSLLVYSFLQTCCWVHDPIAFSNLNKFYHLQRALKVHPKECWVKLKANQESIFWHFPIQTSSYQKG